MEHAITLLHLDPVPGLGVMTSFHLALSEHYARRAADYNDPVPQELRLVRFSEGA